MGGEGGGRSRGLQKGSGYVPGHLIYSKNFGRVVGFYGLDVSFLHASAQAVIQYLKEMDPQAAKVAEARYRCFDR